MKFNGYSAFFDEHRDEYFERLLAVSRDNNWTDWCVFFLKGVRAQAEENQKKALSILNLYDRMKNRIQDLTHSQYAIRALDWLFQKPILKSSDFSKTSAIPKPTASRILQLLKKENILIALEEGKGRRSSTLAFKELLNIAEGHEVF